MYGKRQMSDCYFMLWYICMYVYYTNQRPSYCILSSQGAYLLTLACLLCVQSLPSLSGRSQLLTAYQLFAS